MVQLILIFHGDSSSCYQNWEFLIYSILWRIQKINEKNTVLQKQLQNESCKFYDWRKNRKKSCITGGGARARAWMWYGLGQSTVPGSEWNGPREIRKGARRRGEGGGGIDQKRCGGKEAGNVSQTFHDGLLCILRDGLRTKRVGHRKKLEGVI